MKGIAIFGSLQIYKILLSILTTKVSAVFLGPVGSGIYGLISSILTTTESVVDCGLGTAAVKDFSQAKVANDEYKISVVNKTLNCLVWITGTIGMLVVAFCSNYLSHLTFGNGDYTTWILIVSVTILFNQLISGYSAVMTGLQYYRFITKSRLISGGLAALITITCYSIFHVKGIVPTIILTSLSNLIVTIFFVRKIKIDKVSLRISQIISTGWPMFRMGISIGISYILISLSGLIIRSYISKVSDVATVGLFTASFSMVNTYLGLVFSSIQNDFYPRLSGSVDKHEDYRNVMFDEMELILLLVSPLVAILCVYAQPVLAIFYSTKFYAAKTIICWSALSMLIYVPGWTMSIGLMSTGRTKLYIKNQMIFIAYQLAFNITGFTIGGLTGLGISFAVAQLCYSVQNYVIQRKFYGLIFRRKVLSMFSLSVSVCLALCLLATFANNILLYVVGSVLCLGVVIYCFCALNQRLDITSFFRNKFSKS